MTVSADISTLADWSLFEDEDVLSVIEAASRKVSVSTGGALDVEDVRQEAYILVCSRPDQARAMLDMGTGALYRWLHADLLNLYERQIRNGGRSSSYDALVDAGLELEAGIRE